MSADIPGCEHCRDRPCFCPWRWIAVADYAPYEQDILVGWEGTERFDIGWRELNGAWFPAREGAAQYEAPPTHWMPLRDLPTPPAA